MTPRYSNRPLPEEAYLPGVSPRARRPGASARPSPVERERGALALDEDFRYGVDLFNHGFPWEAHESWEPLHRLAPRGGPERALLTGLVQLAAAAVKVRSGAFEPARRLAHRARGHLARADARAIDLDALLAALAAWERDLAGPPPTIALRGGA